MNQELRNAILSHRNDVPKEKHFIHGVEGMLYGMTALERAQYLEFKKDNNEDMCDAWLVQRCFRDKDGDHVFEVKDLTKLIELDAGQLQAAGVRVFELSFMTADADAKLLKNSSKTPSEGSSSEDPTPGA